MQVLKRVIDGSGPISCLDVDRRAKSPGFWGFGGGETPKKDKRSLTME